MSQILICTLLFFVAVPLLVLLRIFMKIPAELDRLGVDLSLYGYGVATSLIAAWTLGHRIFVHLALRPREVNDLVIGSFILCVLSYMGTLHLSERLRMTDKRRYGKGIIGLPQLRQVLVTGEAKVHFWLSLMLGSLPAALWRSLVLRRFLVLDRVDLNF
jgi:hypothetical protein